MFGIVVSITVAVIVPLSMVVVIDPTSSILICFQCRCQIQLCSHQ